MYFEPMEISGPRTIPENTRDADCFIHFAEYLCFTLGGNENRRLRKSNRCIRGAFRVAMADELLSTGTPDIRGE